MTNGYTENPAIVRIANDLLQLESGKPLNDWGGAPRSFEDSIQYIITSLGEVLREQMPSTFEDWMLATFEDEEFTDIAYGVDGGFNGLTYTADLRMLYTVYHEQMWERLSAFADDMGETEAHILDGFKNPASIDSDDSVRTALVWFNAETVAREFAERLEMGESLRGEDIQE